MTDYIHIKAKILIPINCYFDEDDVAHGPADVVAEPANDGDEGQSAPRRRHPWHPGQMIPPDQIDGVIDVNAMGVDLSDTVNRDAIGRLQDILAAAQAVLDGT